MGMLLDVLKSFIAYDVHRGKTNDFFPPKGFFLGRPVIKQRVKGQFLCLKKLLKVQWHNHSVYLTALNVLKIQVTTL